MESQGQKRWEPQITLINSDGKFLMLNAEFWMFNEKAKGTTDLNAECLMKRQKEPQIRQKEQMESQGQKQGDPQITQINSDGGSRRSGSNSLEFRGPRRSGGKGNYRLRWLTQMGDF